MQLYQHSPISACIVQIILLWGSRKSWKVWPITRFTNNVVTKNAEDWTGSTKGLQKASAMMSIMELRLPKGNALTSIRWVLTPREPWWHFWLSLSLTACTCHSCHLGLTILVQSQLERTLLLGSSSPGITLCSCWVKGLLAGLVLPGKIPAQHRSGLKPCCYLYCAIISCRESRSFPNVEYSSTVVDLCCPGLKRPRA